jgi:hypothetical protein
VNGYRQLARALDLLVSLRGRGLAVSVLGGRLARGRRPVDFALVQ